MTTKELKQKLIDKISDIKDNDLLNDINKLIDDSDFENQVFRLSDEHKDAIDKAISQIERGDYLTNEESNKDIDEWLNK
ncbi:MAG: hypothetical protein ACOC3T_02830 [Bacteroidota bacterium]